MYYDNQAAIFVFGNFAFHERTKHVEIDCHFIRGEVLMGVISTPNVSSSNQLADIFMKSIIDMSYDCLGSKLGMFDLYNPASGGVLDIAYYKDLDIAHSKVCSTSSYKNSKVKHV